MGGRLLSPFTLTLMGMIFVGTLEGQQSAPIPDPFLPMDQKTTPVKYDGDNVITVMFLSCSEKDRTAVNIPPRPGKRDCFNVNLSDAKTVISTNPEDIKLHLFSKESCDGEQYLHDPNSSQNIPFKVASFSIHHESL